jgi:hypothetical protein
MQRFRLRELVRRGKLKRVVLHCPLEVCLSPRIRILPMRGLEFSRLALLQRDKLSKPGSFHAAFELLIAGK